MKITTRMIRNLQSWSERTEKHTYCCEILKFRGRRFYWSQFSLDYLLEKICETFIAMILKHKFHPLTLSSVICSPLISWINLSVNILRNHTLVNIKLRSLATSKLWWQSVSSTAIHQNQVFIFWPTIVKKRTVTKQ